MSDRHVIEVRLGQIEARLQQIPRARTDAVLASLWGTLRDEIAVAAIVGEADRKAIVAGLADAIEYRTDVVAGPGACESCRDDPDGSCDDHLEDSAKAEGYQRVREQLRKEGDE